MIGPAGAAVPPLAAPAGCRICGSPDCRAFPDVDHLDSYPFLSGGRDSMARLKPIPAPHRIVEGGRVLYGTGDYVPYTEAVRLGLVDGPPPADPPAPPKRGRRKRHPAEDRARTLTEDR